MNMCGISLDGASVNSGKKKGLITLMQKECSWIVFMHGIAHVVERCCNDACSDVPYFVNKFDDVVRALCRFRHFGHNPKAMFGLSGENR